MHPQSSQDIRRVENRRGGAGKGSLPLWVAAGAAAILVVVVGVMAHRQIVHQQQGRLQLLDEKGAALIRSFEAGTRTGMMGRRWGRAQLQTLLEETARQPDIRYLLVTDGSGRVLFHSDPQHIGANHQGGREPAGDAGDKTVRRRRVDDGASPVLEVYRQFRPLSGPPGMGRGRRGHGRMHRPYSPGRAEAPGQWPVAKDDLHRDDFRTWILYVGLDLAPVEVANRADMRQTLLVALAMLLVGGAGMLLLFVGQQYAAARSRLERMEAFSDTLAAALPMGLVAVDEQNRISACNPAGARILHRPLEALVGHPVETALPAGLLEQFPDGAAASTGKNAEFDARLENGRRVPLEAVLSRLANDQGRLQGYVVLFRDVSEVRELRRAVTRSRRMAAVGRLAAGVAHEIRNPLSSIKGFATHFRQRYRDEPEDRSIADLMIGEVDRLNRVVTQMIDFARPAAPALRDVSLGPLVAEALKLIRPPAEAGGHRVDYRLPEAEITARADPDQIRQVLLNLLLNAVEAMGDGGAIRVTVRQTPAAAQIRIADSGPGIAAADLPRVFDPYYSTKPAGTGLGLAIVHNIVEAHNGRIAIDSRSGKGTTVTLVLPQGGAGGRDAARPARSEE